MSTYFDDLLAELYNSSSFNNSSKNPFNNSFIYYSVPEDVALLKKQLEQKQKENEDLLFKLNEYEALVKDLETQNNTLMVKLNHLEQVMKDMASDRDRINAQLNLKDEQYLSLLEELEEAQKKLHVLELEKLEKNQNNNDNPDKQFIRSLHDHLEKLTKYIEEYKL